MPVRPEDDEELEIAGEIGEGGEPRVLAVIVAFNNAAVLERGIRALDTQSRAVDGVLVVDNSVPEALEVNLDGLAIKERSRFLRVGENLGPAGGFARGVATFRDEPEWTHAWLMDDDSYPDADALAHLLDVSGRTQPGHVIYPRAVNDETGETSSYPGWSHGPFLDRHAIELGGLPRADLFWWIEDTEYLQHRLPRAGVVSVRAEDAVHHFDQPRRAGSKPPWKYYYEARNSVWYRVYVQRSGFQRLRKLVRTLARLAASGVVNEERGPAIAMLVRGTWDGLRGRLGMPVTPPVTMRGEARA